MQFCIFYKKSTLKMNTYVVKEKGNRWRKIFLVNTNQEKAGVAAAAAAKPRQSCPTLCDSTDRSLPGSLSLGFSRQEHWSGLPFPSPMHESESEVTQSCPTFSDPMDCSLRGSSVHGISQARVLEWSIIVLISRRATSKQEKLSG